ncbi:ABC transporter substrate-binding protein, partial [bacterium]|nr:ABC transporter substrate-binding protein [bacterium]
MFSKLQRPCLMLLLSSFLFTSCGGGKNNDKITFKFRITSDPPSLDPAHGTDTTSGNIILRIFDGLVQFEPKTLAVIPAVAESWEITEESKV